MFNWRTSVWYLAAELFLRSSGGFYTDRKPGQNYHFILSGKRAKSIAEWMVACAPIDVEAFAGMDAGVNTRRSGMFQLEWFRVSG
jgi:hypothetical protein